MDTRKKSHIKSGVPNYRDYPSGSIRSTENRAGLSLGAEQGSILLESLGKSKTGETGLPKRLYTEKRRRRETLEASNTEKSDNTMCKDNKYCLRERNVGGRNQSALVMEGRARVRRRGR